MDKKKSIIIGCIMIFIGCSGSGKEPVQPLPEAEKIIPIIAPEKKAAKIKIKPVVPLGGWTYEKKSIAIRVKVKNELNLFSNASHTVLMGIYQLSDANGFLASTSTKQGIRGLLASTKKASDIPVPGIVSSLKLTVKPTKDEVLVLDRSEKAKFIGIIAGYYSLDPKKTTAMIPIPAVQDPKTGMSRFNLFSKPPPVRPGKLKIWINLDPLQIGNIEKRAE